MKQIITSSQESATPLEPMGADYPRMMQTKDGTVVVWMQDRHTGTVVWCEVNRSWLGRSDMMCWDAKALKPFIGTITIRSEEVGS